VNTVFSQQPRFGWQWPREGGGRATPSGRIVRLVLTTMFLLYLVGPVVQVYDAPHSAGVRFAVVTAVLVYAAVFLTVTVPERWRSRSVRIVSFVVMFGCGLVLALLLGPDDLVYMTYVISMALIQLPPLFGLVFGLSVTAALLVGTEIVDGTPNINSVSILVVLTMALFSTRQVIASNAELREARDEIAALTLAEERARMARDLHDVLGHSLTTITVKAGLARRILESSGDGERAVAELRDVESLSRNALSDVRSTVSGYRKASLPAELVGARVALQAAEIVADLPHAVDNVPAELQEPFAYVLREGVTNVIRHSGARRCEVRLGESWIEIRDDGVGGVSSSGRGPAGHGLAGLVERLAQVGGSLTAGPDPDGGFRVRAAVTA
jgi:two-component system sensor histidine kinase DesK